jgi:hypothetical protein
MPDVLPVILLVVPGKGLSQDGHRLSMAERSDFAVIPSEVRSMFGVWNCILADFTSCANQLGATSDNLRHELSV